MLTVWGRANSINVQKVLWCCEELQLDYRCIDAGGAFGGTDTAEYLALNPNRLVPTIDDEGFQLWESNVIVRYLSQKYGSGDLCPTSVNARFDAERWMDWQATVVWPALRPVFVGLIRTPERDRNLQLIAQAEQQCIRAMSMLDARLANRSFVCGDSFSMGDIPLGASVYRWYALEIAHPPLPNLERWYRQLGEREAYRAMVMQPLS